MRGRWTRRIAKTLATLLALVGLLGVASWYTTVVHWEGGYRTGAFRLEVRSSNNQPIQGATFEVYDAKGQPHNNRFPTTGKSDEKGRLTVYQPIQGIQFGGKRWQLFWMFRMGDKGPHYECEIAAEGYKPKRIEIFDLFESALLSKDGVRINWLQEDDDTVELEVYDAVIVLDR